MATTSMLNEETQELERLFHQTKKTHLILIYNDLADESVKLMLNIFPDMKRAVKALHSQSTMKRTSQPT